jgi:hypothetical protein
MSDRALYFAWADMRRRCNNPSCRSYKNYGARGIAVCPKWDDYKKFVSDMGPHPGKGWSIDRIDNNGDYEPGNVRWATQIMQHRNTRRTKLDQSTVDNIRALYKRGSYRHVDLASIFGVSVSHVTRIINREYWP